MYQRMVLTTSQSALSLKPAATTFVGGDGRQRAFALGVPDLTHQVKSRLRVKLRLSVQIHCTYHTFILSFSSQTAAPNGVN